MNRIIRRTDVKIQLMKHLFYTLLIVILASGGATVLHAQEYTPVPVVVSKEKVRVDGKLYYSHIVTERQTLYSISKAYNVPIGEIYEANPSVKSEGLKKNAILLIPCKGQQQQKKAEVKKKTVAEDDEYVIHTVKWYEDLDAISEKYGVPVNAIMDANGLTGRKLTRRQKLKIPLRAAGSETGTENVAETAMNAADVQTDSIPAAMQGRDEKDKINAILLMPFNTHGEKPRSGSIDFYCGALMAVKQAGDKGMNIDLSVYDVEGDVIPVTKDKFGDTDLVIGPVSPAALAEVLARCPEGTDVISPLDHKAEYLAAGHTNFIQAPTSSMVLYSDLAEWIRTEKRDSEEKVIVIYEKGSRDIQELAAMNTILQKDGIKFSSFSYSILEGRDIQGPLTAMMSKDAANRVLVMSESEAFVNDVVRNLNLIIHSEYEVILYGPSKIRSFDTIEVDNLHNARLHTSLAYYVDYEDETVKDFVRKYRALYNTEPTPYAFQGYDIAAYFLSLYAGHGSSWKEYLGSEGRDMLQADFDFRQEDDGGYVNYGVRRIVYGPDYSITLVQE